MRELGVGLVYWPVLAPLFRAGACEVLELEPQAFWQKVGFADGYQYRLNEHLFDEALSLPQHKLLHGVGQPVGGCVDDPVPYLALLRSVTEKLDPAWVSEHLSFNRIRVGGTVHEAGFLLPPAQTPASARVAAANIARYAAALSRPFAFETGVNYLRPRDDELTDGTFFAMVAAEAHCGIVLDLHNLWCNQRNGRQSIRDTLAQMPLDAVWEVHLAGGMPLHGYWLDAHSDVVPPPLLDLAADVLPQLPNLRALIFEILPEHVHAVGLDAVARELERLQALWRLRSRKPQQRAWTMQCHPPLAATAEDVAATHRHELALYAALRDDEGADRRLTSDPGVAILRELIGDFRRASLARVMRYTVTSLLAALGAGATRELLLTYFRETPADAYAAVEGDRFARFLRARTDIVRTVPYLDEVLAFESALIAVTLRDETHDIEWSADPTAILGALDAGRTAVALPAARSAMRISAS